MRALRLLLLVALLAVTTATAAQASPSPTTVLFVGGYGSSLSTASTSFAALRAAFTARDPSVTFAQYSYAGWNPQSCAPLDYASEDTGQDFATSEQRLLETIYALHTRCGANHIVVVGHSLGGLVAFQALSDNPMAEVTDIITIDSPLGGAPASEISTCVNAGLCASGPVTGVLSDLYANWNQTAADNAARVKQLAAAGIRVTAWGNEGDCLYAPTACVPLASYLLDTPDARDTQWLGIDHAVHGDYAPPRASLASVLSSHVVVLSSAATDIAAAVAA